ncbi:hypothetical protein ACLI1A_14345 [Flavobacterium sp. RHBU_3]|uniref:hypothetical protein n=1 Tax=Flavobacterium sp. RHBU_3 TaxID=3391184 RepID=UPI003984B61B
MKLLKLLAVFLLGFTLYAQEGANDATFNPADTSIGTTVDGPVKGFLNQPDGKLIIYGAFEKYHDIDSYKIVRINADKSIDMSFNIGSALNNTVTAAALQSDGKIVITGYFTEYNGAPVANVIRLNSDGSLDTSFTNGTANSDVYKIKVQDDDKLMLCGAFTTFNGIAVKKVIRLNANGTLDSTFSLAVTYEAVSDIGIQVDGKIVVAGALNNWQVKRFNANGSADSSFSVVGVDLTIRVLEILSDGKIFIGGVFHMVNGQASNGIAKINIDGTIDDFFEVGNGISGDIFDVVSEPEGGIIVVGYFFGYGNFSTNNIVRLFEDGSCDGMFVQPVYDGGNSYISCAIRFGNNVVVGGVFTSYNLQPSNYLRILNFDGTIDYTNFEQPTGANNPINSIVETDSGNMLIGGAFKEYGGQTRNRIALVDANGELLESFNPGLGFNKEVTSICRQADGKYIVIGKFSNYNGILRYGVARLHTDGSLDTSYDLGYLGNVMNGVLQPDGKLILYGSLYISYNGVSSQYYYACRITENGTLDQNFKVPMSNFLGSGSISFLKQLVLLPGGKILINYDGTDSSSKIVRLNTDGSIDNSFPFIGNDMVSVNTAIVPDNDGKYIVSKEAYSYPNSTIVTYRKIDENGIFDDDFELSSVDYGLLSFIQGDGKMFFIKNDGPTSSFKRFNADGALDETFSDHTIYEYIPKVNAVLYQQDKVVIGGRFSRYDGNHRSNIARFNSTGAALQTATPEVVVKPSLISLKKNNTVDVECPTMALSSVAVYDLSGRLVASANKLQDNKVSLKYAGVTDSVLIVQAKLQDGSTLVKKIM